MIKRAWARLRPELPTWGTHSAIATLVTVLGDLSPWLDTWEAWRLAVWGYLFREGDQLLRQWLKRWGQWGTMTDTRWSWRQQWWRFKTTTRDWLVATNWLGTVGDVAAPALVSVLVVLRWLV